MKVNSRKVAALMIVLVILTSIFILQHKESSKNSYIKDSLEVYTDMESISILEEDLGHGENAQLFKSGSTPLFSMFKTYILINAYLAANIFRLRHTQAASQVRMLCFYSVFVVFFANKKDGKKWMDCVYS
ncbi:MAG: hypothetical protein AAGU76_18960 [Sedimentibacter sp.]|uniref:hypothetical protein n=1 Tax=Sedimentibacter sp. TaxID=1960295 RepID=UPI0031597C01